MSKPTPLNLPIQEVDEECPPMSPICEEASIPDLTPPRTGSRRVARWLEAQKSRDDENEENDPDTLRSPRSPYGAYNQLSVRSISEQNEFVLVDEEGPKESSSPPNSRSSGIFNAPSPLRNFRFSFAQSRRSVSANGFTHNRGASLPALTLTRTSSNMASESTRRLSSPWKFRRRNVMSHFSNPPDNAMDNEPPRPSFSSNGSYSTRPSIDTPSTAVSSTSSPAHHRSAPSLWSLPSSASHLNDPPGSTKLLSQPSKSTIRMLSFRSQDPTSPVSSILSPSRTKKRRKHLIISGIATDDEKRFDAIKEWCESFGEIRSINRADSGDIKVDYRHPEDADTVCRVQARVSISGVGSVGLSWTYARP